jgi:hypothetical protein
MSFSFDLFDMAAGVGDTPESAKELGHVRSVWPTMSIQSALIRDVQVGEE